MPKGNHQIDHHLKRKKFGKYSSSKDKASYSKAPKAVAVLSTRRDFLGLLLPKKIQNLSTQLDDNISKKISPKKRAFKKANLSKWEKTQKSGKPKQSDNNINSNTGLMTRNRFFKTAGLAAVGTTLLPRLAANWRDIVNPESIGTSSMGQWNLSWAATASMSAWASNDLVTTNPETRYGDWSDSNVRGYSMVANNGFPADDTGIHFVTDEESNIESMSSNTETTPKKLFFELEMSTDWNAYSKALRCTFSDINASLNSLPDNSVDYLMISGHNGFNDNNSCCWSADYPSYTQANQSTLVNSIKTNQAYIANQNIYRVLANNAVVVFVACHCGTLPAQFANYSQKKVRVKAYSESYFVYWLSDRVYLAKNDTPWGREVAWLRGAIYVPSKDSK